MFNLVFLVTCFPLASYARESSVIRYILSCQVCNNIITKLGEGETVEVVSTCSKADTSLDSNSRQRLRSVQLSCQLCPHKMNSQLPDVFCNPCMSPPRPDDDNYPGILTCKGRDDGLYPGVSSGYG